jgi:hypothetical protein
MNQRVWVLGALCAALLGCANPQTRLQAEDEGERKELDIKTVGKVSTFANTDPMPVSGVGLVVGLEGTGGGAPTGALRTMLEDYLRKRRVEHIKELLDSHDASIVLVSGLIPPGAKKGDPLDIEVTVPRDCKTSSLQGGRLVECILYNYASKKMIDPNYSGPDATLPGHQVAVAQGQLMAGFGDGDDDTRFRQARIWAGGRCKVNRPIYLVLNSDQQFARVAKAVAERINESFQGSYQGTMKDLAVAETKTVVYLGIAPQYRLNVPRYLRVIRQIPLYDTPETRIAYRRRLEEQLLDPAHTVVASLKLEALGQDSIPILKGGLPSEHPLVQFCAAEALAYLGNAASGEVLARMVEQQPALRAFSLTALASLDEAVCHVELRRLLSTTSPETRYGAFRALRALDEQEDAVRGELLNDSFWLHQVAAQSEPLIHFSTTNRAEIILFGTDVRMIPPFPILAGDFTVTAGPDDTMCTITHSSLRHGRTEKQCSFLVTDVLHTMAEMGALYGEAVQLLRRADHLHCLSCKVVVDALPQAVSVLDLAKAGAGDPELLKTHPEILAARSDFGATPTLFEKQNHKAPALDEAEHDSLDTGTPSAKNRSAGDTTVTPERVHGGIQ